MLSLPWPKGAASEAFQLEGRAATALPLGRWPGEAEAAPRRWLLWADAAGNAPEQIRLSPAAAPPAQTVSPHATMELLGEEDTPFRKETHRLTLHHEGRAFGIALGLRTQGQIHWWEACRLVETAQTPGCRVVEMGGTIQARPMTPEESRMGYLNPHLHRHNWLNGRITARLHANGVCELFLRHINSRFFDDGADLEDVCPVVGFFPEAGTAQGPLPLWDGLTSELAVGNVRLDLEEAARLATPQQPGSLTWEEGVLVWQPYTGAELYGGDYPHATTGDPFLCHAEAHRFPRGMARTLRFSLSLSERHPRVVRYLPGRETYLAAGELPTDAQPVPPGDPALVEAEAWVCQHIVTGGFEDGSLPRHPRTPRTAKGRTRQEPGWEGELPYAIFLRAWSTGDATLHAIALRAAYYFADVAIDHASKLVRMHGYPAPAASLPMNRVQGPLAAWLETGDPFLLEEAEAVTTAAHALHRNSWPRLAVGRDACYLRSALLLYRYGRGDFFRQIAHEGALHVAASQRANGSFGDQGGGSGIHAWSSYISKPWMGLLAVTPLLDYLDLHPHEPELEATLLRFADWLMAERGERNGAQTWSYQHDYNGQRGYYDPFLLCWFDLPSANIWHHETLGRLLHHASRATGDPRYLSAWEESRRVAPLPDLDHAVAAALQCLSSSTP